VRIDTANGQESARAVSSGEAFNVSGRAVVVLSRPSVHA